MFSTGEVGKYYTKWGELSTCKLSQICAVLEEDFESCFGVPFKEDLESHLLDYSSARKWNPSNTYSEGDKVIFNGCYWISEIDNNNDEPSKNWIEGQKFDKECLNDFWCKVFAQYLDILIQLDARPAEWLQVVKGDRLTSSEIKIRKDLMQSDLSRQFKRVHQYIMKRKDSGCFDYYKPLNKETCSDCGCKKVGGCECKEEDCLEKKDDNGFWVA